MQRSKLDVLTELIINMAHRYRMDNGYLPAEYEVLIKELKNNE